MPVVVVATYSQLQCVNKYTSSAHRTAAFHSPVCVVLAGFSSRSVIFLCECKYYADWEIKVRCF